MIRVPWLFLTGCMLCGCMSLNPEQTKVITKAEALSGPLTRSQILRDFSLEVTPEQSSLLGRYCATCIETWKHDSGLDIRASKVVWVDSSPGSSPYQEDDSPRRSASFWVSPEGAKIANQSFPIATFDTISILLGDKVIYSSADSECEQPGTGQPATRPVVEPEGSFKPQPEAEGRSR